MAFKLTRLDSSLSLYPFPRMVSVNKETARMRLVFTSLCSSSSFPSILFLKLFKFETLKANYSEIKTPQFCNMDRSVASCISVLLSVFTYRISAYSAFCLLCAFVSRILNPLCRLLFLWCVKTWRLYLLCCFISFACFLAFLLLPGCQWRSLLSAVIDACTAIVSAYWTPTVQRPSSRLYDQFTLSLA